MMRLHDRDGTGQIDFNEVRGALAKWLQVAAVAKEGGRRRGYAWHARVLPACKRADDFRQACVTDVRPAHPAPASTRTPNHASSQRPQFEKLHLWLTQISTSFRQFDTDRNGACSRAPRCNSVICAWRPARPRHHWRPWRRVQDPEAACAAALGLRLWVQARCAEPARPWVGFRCRHAGQAGGGAGGGARGLQARPTRL